MKVRFSPLSLLSIPTLLVFFACSGTDNTSSGLDNGSYGTGGGQATGAGGQVVGAGGQAMAAGGQVVGAGGGQAMATGGQTLGAGGQFVATGGQAVATGGQAQAAYWPAAYNVSGLPAPADGGYHASSNPGACMTCHNGMIQPQLAFGGFVYHADGSPAANVEIGVSDGTNQLFVYSATNGMYWAAGNSATVNWTAADIRMRNASGEFPKASAIGRSADCDLCHTGGLMLAVP